MTKSQRAAGDAPEALVEALSEGGGSEFLHRFSTAAAQLAEELGVPRSGDVDILLLGFLRTMARFGLFSFGPVTIYVPTIEEVVRRTVRPPDDETIGTLIEFSRALRAEQQRSGRRQIDELQMLLAFMRMTSGLPARVFGELGVRPEEVEAYARTGGPAGDALERLYSPEEAAEYLGIHVQTVRAWIRSGRLKASRLAGQRALRIKASDLVGVLEPITPDDLEDEG